MRRIIIAVAALFLSATFVCAQDADKKKDDFHGYWNIHLRGGIGHTVGEAAYRDLISPSASIGFGYRLTPVWSLRLDVNGWQGKGALPVYQYLYSFKYAQANVDALIDLCSIGNGFRSNRVLNPYLLVGIGANARFDNSQAAAMRDHFDSKYFWQATRFSPTGRAGIGLDIRLCDAVDLNVELNTSFLTDKFNSKKGSIVDFQGNALVGLKFNLGKPKAKKAVEEPTPSLAAASEADVVAAEQPKEEPKKEEAKPVKKAPVEVKEVVREERKVDVFFTIGKWNINPSEEAKVKELVDYMLAEKDAKVTITGYADKNTGSAKRNMFLSQKRAEKIAAILIDAGVSSDRIKTEYKGSTEAPYETPVKNRVAICIAK